MASNEKEKRYCPHCNSELDSWLPPPETFWNELLVCNNNSCTYFLESHKSIEEQGGSHRACRYAEEVDCNYREVALVSWFPRQFEEEKED
ncbi:MAG: hypothetical protein ACOC0U_02675 [Desulfovibrionales bacterium]